ncbi:AAA family ATPase [Vreelandella venusta]|uniref:AAA family ATPase n=1 Tax=Vreelandella venusta TaxID=44935 RepID=UPI001168B533|nr:AAA family ATPase [Halomonas venusta]GEK52386.1 ATP-binding protein [Halomonas venusta]
MSENTLAVNTVAATTLMERALRAQIPAMLKGSPGIGKSAIVKALAEKFNLKLIDLRLSQCEPTDLNGFPAVKDETGRAYYAPMDTFPLVGDKVPEGYSGWLLFLDELNQAPDSIQRAAYKLLLDHEVGQHPLHKQCVKLAAGNLITDGAMVEELGTALQSRLLHLELLVDHKAWLEWAYGAGIDYRITSFIEFKPAMLHVFDPDHMDNTFACPRTWEFASKLLNGDAFTDDLLPLLSGTLSHGVAREFYAFTKIATKVVTAAEIAKSPLTAEVPSEPSILFAQTGSIGASATKDNIDPLIQYVERLPMEFQVICLRAIVRRKPDLLHVPVVTNWISNHANDLF